MLIPSAPRIAGQLEPSLSRRVNANSQRELVIGTLPSKLIKKGEC